MALGYSWQVYSYWRTATRRCITKQKSAYFYKQADLHVLRLFCKRLFCKTKIWI
ncbi:hypothetical protein HMPREF1576_00887 [Gardnerella pickettii JCP7719]|uniref:Uncharacterized protein n=1 Tax=Gardnerella pickettii JCP7719 TaxID=1261061 RepID=S4H3Z2_9BIFI|nr:hypothetical protein HMPREF1576_00887 [Gardnerella pickettii JCP7719]